MSSCSPLWIKMSHAESVIKKIIREIVQECAARGHVVSDSLAAFMVKAAVLDPMNGFNVDRTLTKQDIQNLEELCVEKLLEKCSPSLDTVRMQVYFDTNYMSRREFLGEIQRLLESRLSSVSRDITDSRVQARDELQALYQDIITYIVLRSGMGSTTDGSTVQETTAALQSVFPQTELGAFLVLLKRDKEQQLKELAMIVTGIRLFNKASDKSPDQSDLHRLMPTSQALPGIYDSIETELSVSQRLSWKYTAVLEKLRSSESDVPIVLLKQALYNIRQHEAFLRTLLADACVCAKNAEALQSELITQVKLLKDIVQSKTAVPTAKVFPLFKALSNLWTGLQEEAELLNILNSLMLCLQPYVASQAKIFPDAYLDGLLEASEVKTDQQRMVESSVERIDPAEMKTQEWFLPEAVAGFKELPLQYSGMCGYTLVARDGLLLPGNPHIGVLKHKEKFYVFSSKKAALEFSSSPDKYISEIAEKAKFSPELIELLKLHQQFPSVGPCSETGETLLAQANTKCDSSTQTDTHPVEPNTMKPYDWNEWELRRKAIKLADLLTKATHSTQTDLSHMRRENVTQTWQPKDAATQSKKDGESSVPKAQVYLAGLRGRSTGHVVKVDLTRSVDK
ncbi:cilia- and flagella-associated protein 206 isoform X2 [Betta splendens]|uniref:Cilia- and flagella-associated protein 206 n=1 Tax=Betta splendens TaxID=158456 RepID=A0A6P7LNC0_BETSP|nr:cilia- and flagella-associated protein 206 isoform X2 [Betta splendens]